MKSVQSIADIPVLLLAAGSSSRMMEAKQLLKWGSGTLIEHQITTLLKTGNPLNVVLGCKSDLIIPLIGKYEINIIINERWKEGMGSSISSGISYIMKNFPGASGVLIALLDQPLITTSFYKMMLEGFSRDQGLILVSRSVSGWTGVPSLFDKCYFDKLLNLKKDEGAKKVFTSFKEKTVAIDCSDSMEDIDTPLAYRLLLKKYSGLTV